MKKYFDSLPPMIQESMIQSGLAPQTLEELKRSASYLQNDGKDAGGH